MNSLSTLAFAAYVSLLTTVHTSNDSASSVLTSSHAATATHVAGPGSCCPCCGHALGIQDGTVPVWTTEKQKRMETRYRNEERQRTCKVCKLVPVQKEGVVKCTEYVQKDVETKREIEISTPVCKEVEQTYKCLVPTKEKVTKMRTVTKCVPVTETRKVCENGVEREVNVNCMKQVCVEEPYECEVDVCAEIEKTRKVVVWETKKEMKTVVDRRKVVEAVPKTRKVPVTVCEEVYEDKIETYTECVPYEVEVEVDVCVLKRVPVDQAQCPHCGQKLGK